MAKLPLCARPFRGEVFLGTPATSVSCRKNSAGRSQHLPELFLRRTLTVEGDRSGKPSRVHSFGSFANTRKDSIPILRELAQFVNKIDEQELRRELLRNVQSTLKSYRSITERKCTMPFLVVDNAFVVELCRPKPQLVVDVRRSYDKMICSQEGLDELVFVRGSLSKFIFPRAVVQ